MAIYCVRAYFGKYTEAFVNGGFAAIGYIYDKNLEELSRDECNLLESYYKDENPEKTKMAVAQNIGQISRFLFDIKIGDYVVTPGIVTEELFYGKVVSGIYYEKDESCPYIHRKKVDWVKEPLLRSSLSIPLQNTLRASLTVFNIKQESAFLEKIGIKVKERSTVKYSDFVRIILERILELSAEEFEFLVKDLLSVIGFSAEHLGRSGDGGIDAQGELEIYNMAKIDLKVQAKRYKLNTKINGKIVRDFRGSVPEKSQGCIITTCAFRKKAREEAVKEGFKRIGLIDGPQLVEIMIEKYQDLSHEIKEKLKLKPVLMPE